VEEGFADSAGNEDEKLNAFMHVHTNCFVNKCTGRSVEVFLGTRILQLILVFEGFCNTTILL